MLRVAIVGQIDDPEALYPLAERFPTCGGVDDLPGNLVDRQLTLAVENTRVPAGRRGVQGFRRCRGGP